MIPKPLSNIGEPDIQAFKDAGVQEGQTLEFKRDLPGTRDEDKREFLADVSSFANTDGGDMIYGVAEDQGVITDIVGASSPDFDAEILRLENLVRDGVSPRMNAAFRVVSCGKTAGGTYREELDTAASRHFPGTRQVLRTYFGRQICARCQSASDSVSPFGNTIRTNQRLPRGPNH
jgi:schlafen family protein